VQREESKTAARRARTFQSGVEKGLAQGREEAQTAAYQKGLDEGKKIGRAISHAVSDAVLARVKELQGELTDRSKQQYEATLTATDYLVKCTQKDNLIAELERNLANEERRSADLQRQADHLQEQLREARRVPAAGATQSAQLSAALVTRPASTPYLNRQKP
jgi:hypothetical protein